MRLVALFFVMLLITSTAYAKLPGGGIGPGPAIVPLPYYGLSTSAIDHNNNVLVFDVLYSFPVALPGLPNVRTPPSAKTRVTVVTKDGNKMAPVEYDGLFQVIGTGAH